jgi:general secretion pathway protein C
VVSPKATQAAREGLALIAVDGKPPRAYRVGAVIEGTHVLKSVSARGAMLGLKDGGAQFGLSVAPLAAAATGSLPSAGAVTPPTRPTMAPPHTLGPHSGPGRPDLTESAPAAQPGHQGKQAPTE